MTRSTWTASLCTLALVSAKLALATAPAATSLNTCQNAVKVATAHFVSRKVAAIGTCLQAISTQMVMNNAVDASAAASTCVAQFRKLNDSRSLGQSLPEKLTAGIAAKCTPGGYNTHTLGDILGVGAGVSQPLNAADLNAWCSRYGGDGSIDTLQEWTDCIHAAAECDVDSAITAQYPRVLDWLVLVKPSMQALTPPATDLNKITDAVAGLDAVKADIDGPNNDNVVSIQCGGPACGDGVKNGEDACDGSDLGGATCTGLGYASGTLSCAAGCVFNVSGCVGFGAQPLQTGQTTSYGTGSDGDLQKGLARSYTDNVDGTITDNKTGLMWEKKDQAAGGIHNFNNIYTWGLDGEPYTMNGEMVTTFLATLNAGGGFAGHTDWRIPNRLELESIVNLQNVDPAVDAVFNTNCAANCTVTTCSCTQSQSYFSIYWSSTTYQAEDNPGAAWGVDFFGGSVDVPYSKSAGHSVRAVRGGS